MSTSARTSAWQTRWAQLAPKERTGISIAVALVLLATVWLAVVGPGLQQWRTAEAKARALDAQLQQMQTLQAQVQSIQAQPALAYDDAVRALKLATQQALGASAQISVVGPCLGDPAKRPTPGFGPVADAGPTERPLGAL